MSRFFLSFCIGLIAIGIILIFISIIWAPPDIFSGPASTSTVQVLPPDIANLIAQSSTSSTIATTTVVVTTTTPPVFVPPPLVPPSSSPPSATILWGAYAGDTPGDGTAFEALVGRQMNMEAVFVGWGNNGQFPSEFGPTLRDAGKTLVIFWEPSDGSGSLAEPLYNYASIESGTWDNYLTSFAAAAKSYGGPVIIVPFAEMNGNWDPWDGTLNGNSPASFITAWQHVHSFFANAPNVKFGWDPNAVSEPDTAANSIGSYYPGDAYVDYVGADGFNFGNPSQSFSEIFGTAIAQLETYNKPIYIFSMATTEDSGKPAWISDALSVQMKQYPIAGWIWFNENKEQDWRVDSDPGALQAFENALPTN